MKIVDKNNDVDDNLDFYNVALYIDYENVYKTLRSDYQNVIRLGFFEKIRIWCNSNRKRLVKIAVYCNFDNKDLYESYHQSLLQKYGVNTVHTSNQGKNYGDLQMTIDVLEAMYTNNNIDEFMIMSNDKDMSPLLNTIRFNKRKVTIITTGNLYNETLCNFSDEQIKFEDIVKITCDSLEIEKIQHSFYKGFEKVMDDRICNYNGNDRFSHYELVYNISDQMKHYHLMSYEIANIINKCVKQIFFYQYNYSNSSKRKIAIAPIKNKSKMLELGIIKENDIINYDMEDFVKNEYEKYS